MAQKKANFRCPKTGKKFFVHSYKMSFKDGCSVYKDENGKVIKNPENGEELVSIKKKITGAPSINTFGSKSAGERKQIIRDRAKADNAKHKDEWHAKNMGK